MASYNLAMLHLSAPAAGDCQRALELLQKVAERHPAVADALARGADAATGSDGWTRTGVTLGGGGGGSGSGGKSRKSNNNAASHSFVDEGRALSSYLIAAEAGVEVAQSNAAWLRRGPRGGASTGGSRRGRRRRPRGRRPSMRRTSAPKKKGKVLIFHLFLSLLRASPPTPRRQPPGSPPGSMRAPPRRARPTLC